MNSYKIEAHFLFSTPLVFIAVLSAAWLLLNILPIPVEGQLEPEWLNPVIATILLVPSVVVVFKMGRCNLQLNENGLVYTPLFGATRDLTYGDIQKVTTGESTYRIYSSDGKKLISFTDSETSNASEIISFLKSKGVRAEA